MPNTSSPSTSADAPRIFLLAASGSAAIEHKLVAEGFAVTTSDSPESAPEVLERPRFEAIVVVADAGGVVDVCLRLRLRTTLPLLVVASDAAEETRVEGLAAGADYVLSAPLSLAELVARTCAAIRRARGESGPVRRTIVIDDLTLEPTSMRLTRDGRVVALTSYEFQLLYALAARAGKVVTRDELSAAVGLSQGKADDRSIDVHLSRIRAKIGDDARKPTTIMTVRGSGYMFAHRDRGL